MDGKLRNMTSLYLRNGSRILLLYRVGSRVVSPSWCGVGGHFEPEELNDARACVLREALEEIGVREPDFENLKLRYLTFRLKNGEIRQNYYFFSDFKHSGKTFDTCTEGELAWVELDELSAYPMPHTARAVLDHYLREGYRTDTTYAGIATYGGEVLFTPLAEF